MCKLGAEGLRQSAEKSVELNENYLRKQGPRWAEDEELGLMVQVSAIVSNIRSEGEQKIGQSHTDSAWHRRISSIVLKSTHLSPAQGRFLRPAPACLQAFTQC